MLITKRSGARVRQLRQARGLTRGALADEIEVEVSTIVRYETGRTMPPALVLIRLAHAFNVTVGKLLLGEEDDERVTAATRIRDAELLDRFRAAEQLSRDDRTHPHPPH